MAVDPFHPEGAAGRSTESLGPESARPSEAARGAARPPLTELRPRGVGELMDAALDVFVQLFLPLVALSFFLWLPFHVLDRVTAQFDDLTKMFYDLGAGAGAVWVMQSFGLAVIARVVRDHLQGEYRGVGPALRVALSRLLPLLLATALTTVGVMLGTLACLIPGFLANWLFAVVIAVVVLEKRGPIDSIRRGVRLMTLDSAASFLRWLGLFAVGTALLLPFAAVPGLFDYPDSRIEIERMLHVEGVGLDVIDVLLSSVFGAVSTAFTGVWVTLLYFDACVRNDGADLRARLKRLGEVRGAEATA